MAASSQLPPWLTTSYDPIGAFQRSLQIGAQIGEAQTRIAEQQRQANMEHAAKQQAMQANILKAQQEMEMEKAYREQQLSLESARLEETKQRNLQAALQAAASLKERAAYHQDALRKKLTHFTTGGGVLQFDPEANKVDVLREPTNEPKPISPSVALGAVSDPVKAAFIESNLGKPALSNLVEVARSGLPKSAAAAPATTAPAEVPLPLPKKKSELMAGKLYQTSRGPARWDGSQFVKE